MARSTAVGSSVRAAGDRLPKGAATDAVQIAELLLAF